MKVQREVMGDNSVDSQRVDGVSVFYLQNIDKPSWIAQLGREFKELNVAAENDENAANKLIEVGQFCFESLLYE